MLRRLAVAIVLSLGSILPANAANPLAQVSQDWAREWQARKLDAVLALYAPDATFVDASGKRIIGLPAIRTFFTKILAEYSAEPHLTSVKSLASGDLAYDSGDYDEIIWHNFAPGDPVHTRGTYIVILRRVSGQWRISEQVWTGKQDVPEGKLEKIGSGSKP